VSILKYKREITWSLIFNVFTVLITIGFASYLTKNLVIEDFGRYQLIITFIGIVGIFSLKGSNMIINKSIINGNDHIFNYVFWKTYRSVIKIFFTLFLLAALAAVYYDNERLHLLFIALLFLPLLGLERYESILYAKQKFVKVRVLSLFNILFYVLFSITLFEYTDNYLYIFVSMFFVKLLVIVIGLKYSISLLDSGGENNTLHSIKELKEGYKLSLLSFYNVGISYLDRLIIGLIDFKMLAIYAIGILIPLRVKDQLKMVLNILIQSWGKEGEESYINNVRKYNRRIFIISLIVILILSSTAHIYIPIIFSAKYMESVTIVWIFSVSIPFVLSATIFESYIVFFHNTSFYQKVTYGKQIVYLISLSILAPFFDILGIAFAALIRSIYDFSINCIYYHKYKNKLVGA
jgi:O-antigen/teichoic acid export membrane protein